jgi:hypothetical protein
MCKNTSIHRTLIILAIQDFIYTLDHILEIRNDLQAFGVKCFTMGVRFVLEFTDIAFSRTNYSQNSSVRSVLTICIDVTFNGTTPKLKEIYFICLGRLAMSKGVQKYSCV